jgi:hypothetical protein
MFDTLAALVSVFFGVVLLVNASRGTLGQWFAAKFLGRAS